MNRKTISLTVIIIICMGALAALFVLDPEAPGAIGRIFASNILSMLKILPFVFILIALFDVWVNREIIERHLGEEGGAVSFLWAVLLGGTTVGPMIVCLPVAAALYKKGARLTVIFTYIAASTVVRVPMTLFESSYLGVKFTIIRYAVSLPLIIGTSVLMGRGLQKKNYEIKE
ncbi:MAG: permease [Spirochaetales bacterium]|nr:permease [Spirochaetales bacterium]